MRVRPFSNSSHLYSDSKHKHRGHTFMTAALDLGGRYVNPFSNPLDAEVTYAWREAAARPLIAFLSLTGLRPTKCKLPMSKSADKSEIDRSVVPLSREKARTIIFQSRPRFLAPFVLRLCQGKMFPKRSGAAFLVFSLCLLALAVAGE